MVFNKRNIKSVTLIFAVANILHGQGTGSSPFTILRNNTTGFTGEIHLQTNDGHYFGMQAQTTSAGNVLVGMPNTDPSAGTCLGYVAAHQLGWVACSGASALDPTLGLLMTNDSNSGVTGTGDGAHISWDPTNHWIDIQSWFSTALAPIHTNASRVDISLLNETACEGTGCQTQGFRINNNNGNNAIDVTQGGHFNFDTSINTLHINSYDNSTNPAIIQFTASHVDATNFHGNITLNTIPTICPSGFYSRGVDVSINAASCTAALTIDPTLGLIVINQTNTNSTTTTQGMHIFYDPGVSTGRISVYGVGSATGPLAIIASLLQINEDININNITPNFDNTYKSGNGTHRWSEVDSVLFRGNITLATTPTLCASGQYARGVDATINATGCTVAGGSSLDPTLGLVVINDTNSGSTSATLGMHIYYDPVAFTGNINVYNNSGVSSILNINSSNLFLASFTMQVNVLASMSETDPRLDNSFSSGSVTNRWSDTHSAIGHFGSTPGSAIGGGTVYTACNSTCFDDIDAFSNGAGVYWTRSSGGSSASPTAVTLNTTLGVFGSSGFDGSSWVGATTAGMFTQATQTWNSGAHGTNIYFETIQLNSTSPAIRLIIDDTGLTVPVMATGATHAVCVTSGGRIYASIGLSCP